MSAVRENLNEFARAPELLPTPDPITVRETQDPDTRPQITSPGPGQPLSVFADQLGQIIGPRNKWFLKGNRVVEVREERLTETVVNTAFHPVTPTEARTAIERFARTGTLPRGGFVEQSVSREVAAALLESSQFKAHLPRIDRILDVQIPFLHEGELVYPSKGFDPRFNTYCPPEAPEAVEMTLGEAKQLLSELHSDFCFADELAVTLSIARLLTPFCRGIIGFEHRTPVWIFEANRPRAGKDYLAGCTGILYEGRANEDAPLENDAAETKKRITAALQAGRRFMHFANCQGFIQNDSFEQAATGSVISARRLGSNDASSDMTLVNEVEFSLSANTGFQFSEDLNLRCRKISLKYFEEDANGRVFARPDLHGWIRENRSRFLGAFAAFVKHWDESGKVDGRTPFSSFHRWASVIGGIMQACGLGDPCTPQFQTGLTGDDLTEHMRLLFAAAYDDFGGREVEKYELDAIIRRESLFPWWDFEQRGHQTAFGMKLKGFDGRVLGGIQMNVDRTTKRPKYRFTQEVTDRDTTFVQKLLLPTQTETTTGNLEHLGNLQQLVKWRDDMVIREPEVSKVSEVPTDRNRASVNSLLGLKDNRNTTGTSSIPPRPIVTEVSGGTISSQERKEASTTNIEALNDAAGQPA